MFTDHNDEAGQLQQQASSNTVAVVSVDEKNCRKPEKQKSHLYNKDTGQRRGDNSSEGAMNNLSDLYDMEQIPSIAHSAQLGSFTYSMLGNGNTCPIVNNDPAGNDCFKEVHSQCKKENTGFYDEVEESSSAALTTVPNSPAKIALQTYASEARFPLLLNDFNEVELACNVCGKRFYSRYKLAQHKRIHEAPKARSRIRHFECSFCTKKFYNRSALTDHTRIHTGEKPFSCHICSKTFTQQSTMKAHLRVHSKERRFSCDICQRKFIHRSSLWVHVRTHTGNKPFSCQHCNKKFTQSSALRVHQQNHHASIAITASPS